MGPAIAFLYPRNVLEDSFLKSRLSEVEVKGIRYMAVDMTNAGEDGARSTNAICTLLDRREGCAELQRNPPISTNEVVSNNGRVYQTTFRHTFRNLLGIGVRLSQGWRVFRGVFFTDCQQPLTPIIERNAKRTWSKDNPSSYPNHPRVITRA